MTTHQAQRWRGRIWTGDDGAQAWLEDGIIEAAGGVVEAVRPAEAADEPADVDRSGRVLTYLPGLVDLHNHGGAGHSFPTSDLSGCRAAAAYHRSRGTTTMLASLVSADEPTLLHQAAVLAELAEEGRIAGIHLEGPFLSAVRCGAQDPKALIPVDPDLLLRIIEAAGGHLRSITIAPEVAGFDEALRICADQHVIVSLGHSDAAAPDAAAALDAAAAHQVPVTGTHLFNGMPPMQHREPGIAGQLLHAATQEQVVVELIADGVHLDDTIVAIALAAAPDAVALVSDAMAAAGHSDGTYALGGAEVTVENGVARLSAPPGQHSSIAGGTSSVLEQLLRHTRTVLLNPVASSEEDIRRTSRAVRAASRTPARVLGLDDRGLLTPGRRADMVALDFQGNVHQVLVQGRPESDSD